MKYNPKPISSFIAGLLSILLFFIVIKVMLRIGKAEKEGRPVNIIKESIKGTHDVYIDIKEGWSEAGGDSIREKK
jgi:hypothetical protein